MVLIACSLILGSSDRESSASQVWRWFARWWNASQRVCMSLLERLRRRVSSVGGELRSCVMRMRMMRAESEARMIVESRNLVFGGLNGLGDFGSVGSMGGF